MKDASQIYAEARRVIDDKRNLALNIQSDHGDEIMKAVPKYAELCSEYMSCGAKMARLAVKGQMESEEYKRTFERLGEIENEKKKAIKDAGYPEDYLTPKFNCALCGDNGYTDDDSGNRKECECFRKIFGEVALKESNLPVKEGFSAFDESIFAEADVESAKRRIEELKVVVRDFPKDANRLFLGKTGVGKTFSASMAGAEIAKKGVQTVYVSLPELMRTLLYFGEDEKLNYEKDKMRRIIKEAGFLILDELGTEKISDAKQDILTGIIDERLADKTKGTFVITNNTLREIIANYGERIFSRLTTMTIDNVELSDGKDLRQKIK